MRNYAGHRLSPWLGHLMVSRQETARPLLTPGEVMQLPADQALVLVSGCAPMRATKVRYYLDRALKARILPVPKPAQTQSSHSKPDGASLDDLSPSADGGVANGDETGAWADAAVEGGPRQEPALELVEPTAPEPLPPEIGDSDDVPIHTPDLLDPRRVARQAALDPDDGIPL